MKRLIHSSRRTGLEKWVLDNSYNKKSVFDLFSMSYVKKKMEQS